MEAGTEFSQEESKGISIFNKIHNLTVTGNLSLPLKSKTPDIYYATMEDSWIIISKSNAAFSHNIKAK